MRRPFGEASAWVSMVVVPEVLAASATVFSLVAVVVTPHRVYYGLAMLVSGVVTVATAAVAIAVVRRGHHLDRD
jgi:hypothetical protein